MMIVHAAKPLFAWDCLEDSPSLHTIKDLLAALPAIRERHPGTRAVVADLDNQLPAAVGAQPHPARPGAGVADHVADRLDRYPEGGHLDSGREVGRGSASRVIWTAVPSVRRRICAAIAPARPRSSSDDGRRP